MANRWKKLVAVSASLVMAASVLAASTGCGEAIDDTYVVYRTTTTVMPSNWNDLTSQDSNDSQIANFIVSPFYEFDYKFDEAKGGKFLTAEDGTKTINAEAIVPGEYTVVYSAATKLEDVTASVDAKWGYTAEQKEAGGYAYKLTLRDDLKWDDGTEIHAADFVYSMKEQLNPLFMHYRASEYYNQVSILNSRNYLYQGQSGWFPADGPYVDFTEDLQSKIIFNIGNSEESAAYGGNAGSMRASLGAPAGWTAEQLVTACISQMGLPSTVNEVLALQGKTYSEIQADAALKTAWDAVIGWWQTEPNEELDFFVVEYTYPELNFDNVGIYAASENELVLCLANPLQLLKEDGSLSYQAAYYMATLPLVKEDLYESCKIAPAEGSTLWTTNYNTSLATTASFGPYKLTEFQGGKSYTLTRNDNWYGYNLPNNEGQYQVTQIQCEKVEDVSTQWMKFLKGESDIVGIDKGHSADYRNSKYAVFAAETGTTGIQLFSDLNTLVVNGVSKNNNGVLAIPAFRKAVSLAIDRDDFNAKVSTANQSCFGVLNTAYYYDVENGGVYRDSVQAKKALLRAYGFTENANGTWSNGSNITDASFEDAYEALGGSNLTQAKQLIEEAYTELTTNAAKYGYDASRNITLTFGTSVDNENVRRYYDYAVNFFNTLTAGTSLEGKVTVNFDASFGEEWANAFKAGSYDLAFGTGFENAPFNPGYMIGAHLMANSTYHPYWNKAMETTETITLKMPAGDYEGADQEYTMTVMNWYRCLNAQTEDGDAYNFNWGMGAIPESARLEVIAAIEEYILNQYYFIPTTASFSATMLGAKFSYITNEYNTFMGFGGMQYLKVNYTNSEWHEYAKSQKKLEAEYKKTAD